MPAFPDSSILDLATQVPVNINGQTFGVWDETRGEVFAAKGSTTQKATWVFRCLWENRIAMAIALLGGSTNLAGTTIYESGWQYPDNPAWLVQSLATEGDGLKYTKVRNQQIVAGVSPLVDYQRAKVTVSFGIPDFSFGSPLQIGDDELDFSSRSLALPDKVSVLQFADGTVVSAGQIRHIDVGVIGYTRTRYNMAFLPLTSIRACINKVNSAPIFGAATGTVLFCGGRSRRNVTAAGTINWSITYSFQEMEIGFNNLYNPATGTFQAVTFQPGGAPFIASADLNSLFTTVTP